MYLSILTIYAFWVNKQDCIVVCVGGIARVALCQVFRSLFCDLLRNSQYKAYLIFVRQYNQFINFWSRNLNCSSLNAGCNFCFYLMCTSRAWYPQFLQDVDR